MNMDRAAQIAYFLLRVVVGLVFFQAGSMKFFGWFGGIPGSNGAPVPLMTQVGLAGVLETFGGAAIMLGFLARPVAFIVSGEMAVAYWQFHAPGGTWPIQNHGEPAVLLCFIFLYMSAQGAGPWSLDALIARARGKAVGSKR